MDSLRGQFPGYDAADEAADYGIDEDDTGHEAPPSPIGQDERRMQVRAYNFWAGLLDGRNFPSIEDLDPEDLPDFGPFSVLLDFTAGIEDPGVQFLGARLAEECAGNGPIRQLSDVPSRSLLSRITDHYMQILANQAPIGFEAEFVNQRDRTILYRGILLPFSSDDEAIDFIYGVINWKEMADQQTTDELLLEIDSALEVRPEAARRAPLADWADGPLEGGGVRHDDDDDVLDLVTPIEGDSGELDWPAPAFGQDHESPGAPVFATRAPMADLDDFAVDDDPQELADWLASARELAQAAKGSEDRSRQALYAAIGRAYDFSLAAAEAPLEFGELVTESGLTVQERAPMTPVVKLVFGADYDKTRLTEYATALSHAQRIGLRRGELAGFLISAPGGLKGVVTTERRLKREESGKTAEPHDTPREALARKLRKLDTHALDAVSPEGAEFTVLVARRMPDGRVVLLGEVADDIDLLERAARKLLA